MALNIMEEPVIKWSAAVDDVDRFRKKFDEVSDEEWLRLQLKSSVSREIDGVMFPGFPDAETQRKIHGAPTTEIGIKEAHEFWLFCKKNSYGEVRPSAAFRLLDFGSGWGRIHRPFMRDVSLNNIFAYEPNFSFAVLCRTLNPYINITNGGFLPDGALPQECFELVVGWSIFSHLSPMSAAKWLTEIYRVLKPGGRCIMTTWGKRFLARLERDQKWLAEGRSIDWYSKVCIDAAGGDIARRFREYDEGKHVWFTAGKSDLYGEAFLSEAALRKILASNKLGFEITEFDCASLAQDCFVLHKK